MIAKLVHYIIAMLVNFTTRKSSLKKSLRDWLTTYRKSLINIENWGYANRIVCYSDNWLPNKENYYNQYNG